MPKKSNKDGGETKKSRRTSSSNKDARNSSTTSPASSEVLLPPTPSATHLVASNPFDDPPSSNLITPGPMVMGPSHYPMHSPMHNPGMGSPTPMQMGSPWGSNSMPPHRIMRPYGSPGAPNWNPNSGEMLSPNHSHMIPQYQPMPIHQQQVMSPTGYNYNRMIIPNHPNMGNPHQQVQYHGPPRMPPHRFGDISPPMVAERMHIPRMPMHIHNMQSVVNHGNIPISAANQMKILTRPMVPNPPTNSSGRKSGKSDSRRDSGSTTPKSKKKTKSSESKAAKMNAINDSEEKGGKSNLARTNSKSHLTPPVASNITPPHKIPTILPQICSQCSQEILSEDCICCLASCNTWYHRTCAGLTIEAFECLKCEELALWACDNCLRTKDINSVRLQDQVHTDNNLMIAGKA